MSAEAVGWVYRHSPFSGATFLVHLAIADSVNDQHDNEFWMAQRNLATKTRMDRKTIQRSLPELLDGGFLEQLDDKRGVTILYRFLFPEADVVYETRRRKVRQDVATPPGPDVAGDATGSRTGGDTSPPKPNTSQRTPTWPRDKPLSDDDLLIAERSAHHRRLAAERAADDAERAKEPRPTVEEVRAMRKSKRTA